MVESLHRHTHMKKFQDYYPNIGEDQTETKVILSVVINLDYFATCELFWKDSSDKQIPPSLALYLSLRR